jgi:hypothetical protein
MTADLASYGVQAPVMCQNMMSGPTVIASDPKETYAVTFAGRGDRSGDDVQPIPREMLAAPAFARSLRQGVLKVIEGEEDPLVQSALARQTSNFRDRMAAEELTVRESIDEASDNDMIVVTCIGPGTRPEAPCGEQIPVRAREKDNGPPLCARHAGLAERCVRRGSGPWTLED